MNQANLISKLRAFIAAIDIRYYFLLLIAARVLLAYRNFTILNPDVADQLNSLYNLMHGKGISIADFHDNIVHFSSYNYNASGLVLFLLPLNLLFHNNITSVFVLDIIEMLLFVLFLYKFMALLQIEVRLQKMILLFFAVVQSPFAYNWPADSLSMILCLWGFYFTIKNLYTNKTGDSIAGLLFIGLSYLVKYSYFPFFFFPFLMNVCVNSTLKKENVIKLLKLAALTALAGVAMFLVNYLLVGQRVDDLKPDGHIHFKNLRYIDGFLFHLGDYETRMDELLHGPDRFFLISQAVSFFALLFFTIKMIACHKKTSLKFNKLIAVSAGVSVFLILAFLSMLSLLNIPVYFGPYPSGGHGWTYVIETRYYSPAIILAYLFIIIYLFYYCKRWIFITLFALIGLINLAAFRSLILTGTYGEDLVTNLKMEAAFKNNPYLCDPVKKPVVVCDSITAATPEWIMLQSMGNVYLVNEAEFKQPVEPGDTANFIYLALRTDSNKNVVLEKY
jgi:hypothetical protein